MAPEIIAMLALFSLSQAAVSALDIAIQSMAFRSGMVTTSRHL